MIFCLNVNYFNLFSRQNSREVCFLIKLQLSKRIDFNLVATFIIPTIIINQTHNNNLHSDPVYLKMQSRNSILSPDSDVEESNKTDEDKFNDFDPMKFV